MENKTKLFENKITLERYVCDNVRMVQVLDGHEFITVHRPGESRQFLIRKDSLQEVVNAH